MIPVPSIPGFVHRKNCDGTFDSFCRGCFVTVAKTRLETELEGEERGHMCNPWDLLRFQSAGSLGCSQPGS